MGLLLKQVLNQMYVGKRTHQIYCLFMLAQIIFVHEVFILFICKVWEILNKSNFNGVSMETKSIFSLVFVPNA